MNLGFMPHGTISKKKRIHWEGQLLAFVRDFKDGITFFKLRLNLDLYKDSHSPAFQIELTIFNVYNHIWIYQNNPDDEWNDFTE
jgi:hypothetical protein